ncbi:hypothetical protein AMK59_2340 [Oryctes borbonicus]|uniref:Uncharacterized protein n=1 Tax=Oryctes borbonicus TaxID=1629725 RepID=A0A0T6BB12_9SCAR|nr:hypothetical protein AMK59_2340 [Oryctes borbonicus]
MYGHCNNDTNTNFIQNCNTSALPQTLQSQTRELLRLHCPFLFDEYGEDPELCCADEQVQEMVKQVEMLSVFSRCPTCLKNIKGNICLFSCSPRQNEFIIPTQVAENGSITGEHYILEVDVLISEVYMNTTFESCKQVSLPSAGGLIMETLACVDYGSAYCTPQRFFDYMGLTNPYLPFRMNYIPQPDNTEIFFHAARNCNEVHQDEIYACSCIDCELSCLLELFPEAGDSFLIIGLNGFTFIVAAILCAFSFGCSIAIYFLTIRNRRTFRRKGGPDNRDDRVATVNKFNSAMEIAFRYIGIYMAKYSTLVLFFSSYLVIALGYGAFNLSVTTNPVEIWAGPRSRSRLEKDFFDENFRPFYRTEQIFIKAVNVDSFEYYSSIMGGDVTLGPAFDKTFLLEVFKLQKLIEEIKTDDNIGLKDMCYAPLQGPFSSPRSINSCTVMSLLGLFDNNIDDFEKAEDYIDHMIFCSKSPYNPECLAPYGGPIEPGLGYAGASSSDYTDAIGVGLTFLVSNTLDPDELKPILEWEAKFIEFLQDWDVNDRPDTLDIAFSSERSIEDEIDRLSESEVSTVVISYAIMFIYITIALGKLNSCKEILVSQRILMFAFKLNTYAYYTGRVGRS